MNISAQDVLLALFNPEDTVCFRVFDDKKKGVFSGAKLEMEAGKYSAIEPTLKSHNEKNRGIFFVVNYGGQEDSSISRINAQFVEMDKFRMEADGIFLFALEGLKRLMKRQFMFAETEVNKAELQQYREDSDSVLSFVREHCEFNEEYEVGSTEMFNAYKGYCEECGLKPYSQRMFVQQLTTTMPNVKRGVDALGKRRILSGVRLCDMLG